MKFKKYLLLLMFNFLNANCLLSKKASSIVDTEFIDLEYRDIYGNLIKKDSKSNKKIIKATEKQKDFLCEEQNYVDNETSLKSICLNPLAVPDKIEPIDDFDLDAYLGQWYEIARLNHSFERNLKKVTACYTKLSNEKIRVVNRGFKPNGKQRSIKGKGYFIDKNQKNLGHLKISFFPPFCGSYVIFHAEYDPNKKRYEYALVCGSSYDFCWILSRNPKIPNHKLKELKSILKKKGFKVNQLIYSWKE